MDVDRKMPEQSSIDEPTDLGLSASETSNSTASATTPARMAFLCERTSPAGIRSTAMAISGGDAAMEESPNVLI